MERDNNYNQENRLQELGGSDFEIADNQPNIKGWTVKDPQGQTVGEVEELIFDVQSRKVRYMVVDLEGSTLDLEPRNVLVPIGVADLHESDDDVILPSVTVEQLRSLPTYQKGSIDREHESSIRSIFGGAGIGAAAAGVGAALTGSDKTNDNDNFYEHDHFSDRSFDRRRPNVTDNEFTSTTNVTGTTEGDTVIPIIEENLNVGKREVETGGVHISSRLVEKPVEEHVRLREERVFVEHTPVNRPISESELNSFQEGEIELTEHAEVPVVNKEARVVEEVTLEKEVEEHDEVIRDTVRHTEVDVDDRTTGTETGTTSTQTDVNLTTPDPSRTGTTTNPDLDDSNTPHTGLGSIATGTTGTGLGKTGSGFTDTDRDRGSLTSDPTLI